MQPMTCRPRRFVTSGSGRGVARCGSVSSGRGSAGCDASGSGSRSRFSGGVWVGGLVSGWGLYDSHDGGDFSNVSVLVVPSGAPAGDAMREGGPSNENFAAGAPEKIAQRLLHRFHHEMADREVVMKPHLALG